jgi:hypothetical protein
MPNAAGKDGIANTHQQNGEMLKELHASNSQIFASDHHRITTNPYFRTFF